MRCGRQLTTSVILLLALCAGALGQDQHATKPPQPPSAPQPQAQPSGKPSQPQVVMPDAEKIVLLLRNTLITLNDALQTGNFTVLRDAAAPGFREANSAAKLSRIFANLNDQGIDLSPVSVITPQLAEAPRLDPEKGMLHLKGYFPGQPVQINFEVLYQAVNGRWRLFGLSVQRANSITPSQITSEKDKSGDPLR
jgi:hypothetical protein